MDELRTRAQLIAFDPASVGPGSIGTVVPRAEFAETAARGEFPATLLLDLDRIESGDGGEVTAHARVAVDWDKDTLDSLLASTEDDEIGLWFDERELAEAFDDVEGHGLREKAAVLAITVAAAGASATPGLASPFSMVTDGAGGGAAPAATSVAVPQTPAGPMGAQRGLQMDREISGGGGSAHHARPQTGATSAAVQQPTGAERGLQMDAEISGGQAQPQVTGTGGSGVSTPSPGEIAGIAAGAALLISAAGFGVARRRTPPAQPA